MSRRRLPEVGKSSVRGLNETQREGKPLVAADLGAFLDARDAQGHRLVRFERLYSETDPQTTGYEGKTLGSTTRMSIETEDGDEFPSRIWFYCKACRDRAEPPLKVLSATAVRDAVTKLWDAGIAKGGDTPVTGEIRADE